MLKKRLFGMIAVLAAVMLVIGFAGCGGAESGPTGGDPGTGPGTGHIVKFN